MNRECANCRYVILPKLIEVVGQIHSIKSPKCRLLLKIESLKDEQAEVNRFGICEKWEAWR